MNPERENELSFNSTNAPDGMYVVSRSSEYTPHSDFPLPSIYTESTTAKDSFEVNCNRFTETFAKGDIVAISNNRKKIIGVLSSNAKQNTLLVTEKCDNLCSFCSQPPNDNPDTHLYVDAAYAIINFNTESVVGITGGEPLLGKRKFATFLDILNKAGNTSPLHILTNGRAFSDSDFCSEVVELASKRYILWGIPLHGHNHELHDKCVSMPGAFVETMQGLINLSYSGQSIELRTVVTKDNYKNLINISELVNSSFPFIFTHAIMNLEPKGWAKRNFDVLYISVKEQMPFISECVFNNSLKGLESMLFNYPLCETPKNIQKYYCKSISDWKNYYPAFCNSCPDKKDCGGFFSSSVGDYLNNIKLEVEV
jgi:His-Xaa-Ser system radical SAM maturase HxsC